MLAPLIRVHQARVPGINPVMGLKKKAVLLPRAIDCEAENVMNLEQDRSLAQACLLPHAFTGPGTPGRHLNSPDLRVAERFRGAHASFWAPSRQN